MGNDSHLVWLAATQLNASRISEPRTSLMVSRSLSFCVCPFGKTYELEKVQRHMRSVDRQESPHWRCWAGRDIKKEKNKESAYKNFLINEKDRRIRFACQKTPTSHWILHFGVNNCCNVHNWLLEIPHLPVQLSHETKNNTTMLYSWKYLKNWWFLCWGWAPSEPQKLMSTF